MDPSLKQTFLDLISPFPQMQPRGTLSKLSTAFGLKVDSHTSTQML